MEKEILVAAIAFLIGIGLIIYKWWRKRYVKNGVHLVYSELQAVFTQDNEKVIKFLLSLSKQEFEQVKMMYYGYYRVELWDHLMMEFPFVEYEKIIKKFVAD